MSLLLSGGGSDVFGQALLDPNGAFYLTLLDSAIIGGDTTSVASVTRAGGTTGAVGVNVQTGDGTALTDVDFVPIDAGANFGDTVGGSTTVGLTTIMAPGRGDVTLTLFIYDPSGGATLFSPTTVTITINQPEYFLLESFAGSVGTAPAGWTLAGSSDFDQDGAGSVGVVADTSVSLPGIMTEAIPGSPTDFMARLTFKRGLGATAYKTGIVFDFADQENWRAYVIADSGPGAGTNLLTCEETITEQGGAGADSSPQPGATGYLFIRVIGELLLTTDSSAPESEAAEGNWLLGDPLASSVVGVLIDKAYSAGGNLPTVQEFRVDALPAEVALHEVAEQGQFKMYNPGDTAVIRFIRYGPLTGAVALTYQTYNSTATAGVDYTAASGTLNWADGEGGIKSFNVTTSPSAVADRYFNAAATTLNGQALGAGFAGSAGCNVKFAGD